MEAAYVVLQLLGVCLLPVFGCSAIDSNHRKILRFSTRKTRNCHRQHCRGCSSSLIGATLQAPESKTLQLHLGPMLHCLRLVKMYLEEDQVDSIEEDFPACFYPGPHQQHGSLKAAEVTV